MTHPSRCLLGALLLASVLCAGPAHAQEALTLQEAVRVARTQNFTIQQAENVLAIAENDYSLGNADFLPRLSLQAGYNGTLANTEQTFIERDPRTITGALTTRRSAQAALGWTVFDGLRRFATYERLGVQRDRTATGLAQTTELVLADVVVAYYDIIRQQQQLAVFEEAIEISAERVRIAELRLDLGSASELEVRQARLDLNADRAAALRQEVALENAKTRFNELLGRPSDVAFVAVDDIAVDTTLTYATLLDRTLAESRAVTLAEQAVAVADLEVQEVRAERLPTVDATLGYGYSNLTSESGFLEASSSYDLTYGLALSYPLFDGFNRRRRIENAELRRRNEALALEETRVVLQTEVESLFKAYANDLRLIELERENLTYASQNVAIALERFRLGTITSVELREVQEQLTQAQTRLLVARFDAKRTEIELRRLARLLEVA